MNAGKIKEALEELGEDYVALFIINAREYLETNMTILRNITKNDATGIYVTINRPYDSLKKMLQQSNADTKRIFFIDCITKTLGHCEEAENVLYLESSQNLTGLSIAIAEAIKALPGENKFLILDSLTALVIYNPAGAISKFLHYLTSKMRMLKLRGILFSIGKEVDPKIAEQLQQFVDKVIDLGE